MRFLLLGFLLLSHFLCFAQFADNTDRNDKTNVYYQSLLQYVNDLRENKEPVPDTIFIESDFKFTDSLLNEIGKTKLIVLDYEGLRKLLEKRQSLVLYRLFPLEYQKKRFSISFVPFIVSYEKEKDNINYINPGSYQIYFLFDNGKFLFDRIESHGI